MKILVLNAGSSSQKSCLYDYTGTTWPEQPLPPCWSAHIDWTETGGTLQVKAQGQRLTRSLSATERPQALALMLDTLVQGETQVLNRLAEIDMVGHRVVHGGTRYSQAILVTPEVAAAIAALSTLAPAHNPANLAGIEAMATVLGDTPQVAVFDTAFHSQMPLAAVAYPIPYEWFERGIRRYGFHGISHQYCAHRAAQILGQPLESLKLITCHLGNGCSLAAVRDGISIDTTMGFTPLEGLMMGNRSGSIDPAILIHLLREHGFDADQLDHLLNQASGLKGISQLSNDMRTIMAAIAEGNAQAQLAFDLYIHRLRAGIGAMLASLGGVDALIFTAGVGENNAQIRAQACAAFPFLGLRLDAAQNAAVTLDSDIATPDSLVRVLVVHTQEDWAIARECWQLYPR